MHLHLTFQFVIFGPKLILMQSSSLKTIIYIWLSNVFVTISKLSEILILEMKRIYCAENIYKSIGLEYSFITEYKAGKLSIRR